MCPHQRQRSHCKECREEADKAMSAGQTRTKQCTLLPGHHVCFAHVKHSTLTCGMRVYDVMYIHSELILYLHDTSVTSEAVRTQE